MAYRVLLRIVAVRERGTSKASDIHLGLARVLLVERCF